MKKNRNLIQFLLLTVLLTACAPISPVANIDETPPKPTGTTLLRTTATPSLESTIIVATKINLHKTATATLMPIIGDNGTSNVITLEHNNQAIILHPNDTLLLKLEEIYDWEWQIDNQEIISQLLGVEITSGSQGVFKAQQPGIANLNATGDPKCRKVKPACGMPSISFHLQIEVIP